MIAQTASTAELLQDLRRQLVARGWARKATGRVLLELLLHLAVAGAGTWAFFHFQHPLLRACAVIVVVAGSMGVGTNTHTSSHYATSDKRWLNELLTFFGYPFFLGLGASFWWHQHVVVHHPAPNVIGVDDDADLAPWLARTRDEQRVHSGPMRFYYEKVQWLVLPALLAVNAFNMQKSAWIFLIGRLRDRNTRNAKHWIDLGSLLLHYLCMVVLPGIYFGFLPVVGFYLIRNVLMGYAMFAVLAPGHFPVEAACYSQEQRRADFLYLQTSASLNFSTGWIGRLLCSGLQYQIEHHLFPHLSHVHYPGVSTVVKEFCLQHGLPYRCYSWDVILWKSLMMFRRPPDILHG